LPLIALTPLRALFLFMPSKTPFSILSTEIFAAVDIKKF